MTYDTVFISDIHLGTDRCDAKSFNEFLQTIQTKKLVIVGDILDIHCMEKYNTHWRKEHTKAIHNLFKLRKKGTEIVYILGNHESELRRYEFKIDNLLMCNEYVHKDSKGNEYLCVHGDKNSEYSSGSWKQYFFNWGYETITPLSNFLNRYVNFSLISFLKNTVRGRTYIDRYETDLANYCKKRQKFKGIIVGHIHHANVRQFDEILYMCCGDWVDTCSAIYEKDGIYKLKYWKDETKPCT